MTGAARLRLGPRAGGAFVVLLAVSTAFPVIAALLPASATPSALGLLDVAAAAIVVVLGFTIESLARDRVSDGDRTVAWSVVRIVATVPLRLLLVLAILVAAACGTAEPPSVVPHNDCALVVQPGPNPPQRDGGDAIDGADFGGGRWRLCLAEPIVGAAESTAWCHWTPDRSTVLGISGLGVTIGAFDYDATLSIPRNEFALRRNDLGPDPVNAGYIPGPLVPFGEGSADGRSGHLTFELVPSADPEVGLPVGVPPRLVGVMRWQCGDAPPPRR